MAAEQKARSTYDYILSLTDDPDVIGPIKFLREGEIVHFQRFGEALEYVSDYLAENRVFSMPKADFMKKGSKSEDCKCEKDLSSGRSLSGRENTGALRENRSGCFDGNMKRYNR